MSFNDSELRYACDGMLRHIPSNICLSTISQCYQNHHVSCNAVTFNMGPSAFSFADSDPGSLKNLGDPDTELGF